MKTHTLRDLQERIGGPYTITWTAFTIVIPLALLANLNHFGRSTSTSWQQGVWLSLAGLSVSFLIVLTARQLLFRRTPGTVSPLWFALGIYALLGATRSIVPAVATAFGWTPHLDFSLVQLLQNIASSVLLFSLLAVAIDALNRQQRKVDELANQSLQLEQLRTHAADQLAYSINRVQKTTTTKVTPTIASFRNAISDLIPENPDTQNSNHTAHSALDSKFRAQQLELLAEDMRTQLRESVQQISRELVSEPTQNYLPTDMSSAEKAPAKNQPLFGSLFSSIAKCDPVSPLLNMAVNFLLFLWIWIYLAGWTGILLLIATAAASLTILLSGKLLMSRFDRWHSPIWLVTMLTVGACLGISNTLSALNSNTPPTYLLPPFLVGLVVQLWIGTVIAAIKSSSYQLKLTTRELEATNELYRRESEGLQQATSSLRRRSGNILHGDIQGRLVANALRIDLAAQATTPVEQGHLLEQVVVDLDQISARINHITDTQIAHGTLRDNLDTLARQWKGVLEITICPILNEPGSLSLGLISAITEVIREGINNAAKHSTARAVVVQTKFSNHNVELVVSNDGRSRSTDYRDIESIQRVLSIPPQTNELKQIANTTQLRVIIPLNRATQSQTNEEQPTTR